MLVLRFQDDLAQLADRALAALRLGDEVGDRLWQSAGIADGRRQPDVAEQLVVVDVVADVGDLLQRQAKLLQQRRACRSACPSRR